MHQCRVRLLQTKFSVRISEKRKASASHLPEPQCPQPSARFWTLFNANPIHPFLWSLTITSSPSQTATGTLATVWMQREEKSVSLSRGSKILFRFPSHSQSKHLHLFPFPPFLWDSTYLLLMMCCCITDATWFASPVSPENVSASNVCPF